MPMYELTCQLGDLDEPPPLELERLLAATSGNQPAMDGFVSMYAGGLPIPEFFSPQNVERIMLSGSVA